MHQFALVPGRFAPFGSGVRPKPINENLPDFIELKHVFPNEQVDGIVQGGINGTGPRYFTNSRNTILRYQFYDGPQGVGGVQTGGIQQGRVNNGNGGNGNIFNSGTRFGCHLIVI